MESNEFDKLMINNEEAMIGMNNRITRKEEEVNQNFLKAMRELEDRTRLKKEKTLKVATEIAALIHHILDTIDDKYGLISNDEVKDIIEELKGYKISYLVKNDLVAISLDANLPDKPNLKELDYEYFTKLFKKYNIKATAKDGANSMLPYVTGIYVTIPRNYKKVYYPPEEDYDYVENKKGKR